MNTFKRLALAITLALLLAGTAFAEETSSPPCSNDPGEVNGPPCPTNQMLSDDSVDQNVASSSTVETVTIEAAISAIENLLTIY
jgi:hypothetical protein